MKASNERQVNIGISRQNRRTIADGLSRLLADTYILYLKTQNFHWNVTGPSFYSLHKMFEEQYQGLALATDEIAERIRALGFVAPGSFASFSKLTSLKEDKETLASDEMLRSLAKGHEILIHTAQEALASADTAGDQPTIDLVTERMEFSEKTAWMLKSSLG